MAILAILTLIVAVIGVLLLTQVMKLFQPGERKMQQEVNNMRLDMQKWVGELVPIDKKELELFSLSQIKQVMRKRWTTSAKGIFTTIYNEPIVAYSYKQFLGRGRHALLYARSASHEYAYWIKPKGVQVVIDNKLVGTYKDNTLLSAKSENLSRYYNQRPKTRYSPFASTTAKWATWYPLTPPQARASANAPSNF
ncbi:MAG: hypothetical protein IPN33_05925 [Saprospiraceae bacterium]|nr:hypothetical protein [Saprospiraceae bacterium]